MTSPPPDPRSIEFRLLLLEAGQKRLALALAGVLAGLETAAKMGIDKMTEER